MIGKDSRIIVIGAGPGGIISAYQFREAGYTNVKVLERDSQLTERLTKRTRELGLDLKLEPDNPGEQAAQHAHRGEHAHGHARGVVPHRPVPEEDRLDGVAAPVHPYSGVTDLSHEVLERLINGAHLLAP